MNVPEVSGGAEGRSGGGAQAVPVSTTAAQKIHVVICIDGMAPSLTPDALGRMGAAEMWWHSMYSWGPERSSCDRPCAELPQNGRRSFAQKGAWTCPLQVSRGSVSFR